MVVEEPPCYWRRVVRSLRSHETPMRTLLLTGATAARRCKEERMMHSRIRRQRDHRQEECKRMRARAQKDTRSPHARLRKVQRKVQSAKIVVQSYHGMHGGTGTRTSPPPHPSSARALLAFCGFENGVCGFEKSRPNFPDGPLSGKVRCSPESSNN